MSWTAQVRTRMKDGTSFVGDGAGETDEEALAEAMAKIAEQDTRIEEGWSKKDVARLVIVMVQNG